MILYDVPWDDYLQMPGLNPSTAVHGLKSMRELRHQITSPEEKQKPCILVGKAAHSLLELTPEQFEQEFVVMPPLHLSDQNWTDKGMPSTKTTTNRYKELVAQFEQENEGKEIVAQEDYDTARNIIAAVHSHVLSSPIISEAKKEVTVTGEINGVPCRGRIDLLGEAYLADLKTTNDITPKVFGKTFARFNYGFKLRFYQRLLRENDHPCTRVYILAVESGGAYDRCRIPIHENVLEQYDAQIDRVTKQYAQCLDTGKWPGIAETSDIELELSNWDMPMDEFTDLEWEA